MRCEQAAGLLTDSLLGELTADQGRALDAHLESCERCRAEVAGVESLWQELGDLEATGPEVPSVRLTQNFRRALANHVAELGQRRPSRFGEWWAGLWASHPVWQASFAAALLLIGLSVGASLGVGKASQSEVDALRTEMATMSRAVTISLLQHQSAAERLRAVSWSRMAGADDRVLSALLDSARLDPNVNVRLAAIDALAAHANSGPVRAGLIDNLPREESPLVQLAVLQVVAGEEGLRNGELQKLIDSGKVDATVLQHFAAQAESI